jgi:hypothetical protein
MSLECSAERPWGIHPIVRNDEDCPRCGWTAPGPRGDALADAEQASALATSLGWSGLTDSQDEALAA